MVLLTQLPWDTRNFRLDSDFLRYINLRRDQMAEMGLRLVLFLHESDMRELMETEGDFCHHTFWLEEEDGEELSVRQALEAPGFYDRPQFRGTPITAEEEVRLQSRIASVFSLMERSSKTEVKLRLVLDLVKSLRHKNAYKLMEQVLPHGLELLKRLQKSKRLKKELSAKLAAEGDSLASL